MNDSRKACNACPAGLACVAGVASDASLCLECGEGEVLVRNPGHEKVMLGAVNVLSSCPRTIPRKNYYCTACWTARWEVEP